MDIYSEKLDYNLIDDILDTVNDMVNKKVDVALTFMSPEYGNKGGMILIRNKDEYEAFMNNASITYLFHHADFKNQLECVHFDSSVKKNLYTINLFYKYEAGKYIDECLSMSVTFPNPLNSEEADLQILF